MMLLADQRKAAATRRPSPDLTQLIHPVSQAEFQHDYWEQKPLLIHRDDPGYYSDLLTLDDLDAALSMSWTAYDHIRVVKDGREINVLELLSASKTNALEALLAHYRNGHTIVVNSLDGRWGPLQQLSRALTADLSARVQMNIYLTPAGNQGFKPHYDMHDVFVAQVHGSKRWAIASQPYPLPLRDRPYNKLEQEPEPDQEFDLCCGDLLYLPRGTIHWAKSNETASMHITMGVHPVLWRDLVVDAVKQLCADDVRFRRAMPMGFDRDESRRTELAATAAGLLDTIRERICPQEMAGTAYTRAASIAFPTLRHHLTDLEVADQIGIDTLVRRRAGQRCQLTVADAAITLAFHDKTVGLPARVADEVQYAANSNGDGFTARDLPGDLDEAGRVTLVGTLVREGFLTVG